MDLPQATIVPEINQSFFRRLDIRSELAFSQFINRIAVP